MELMGELLGSRLNSAVILPADAESHIPEGVNVVELLLGVDDIVPWRKLVLAEYCLVF